MQIWLYDYGEVKELNLYGVGEDESVEITEQFILKFDNNGLHLAPEQIVCTHKVKYEMSYDDYSDWCRRLNEQQRIMDAAYKAGDIEASDNAVNPAAWVA
jgi:hypothetical protein